MLGLSLRFDLGGHYSGVAGREPGTFDARWTLYERGLDTEYASPMITLASGGPYVLPDGMDIEIDGVRTSDDGNVSAGAKIRVFATTLNEYFVDGVSGTLALVLTIDEVDCTFTLVNMAEPGANYDVTMGGETVTMDGETVTMGSGV